MTVQPEQADVLTRSLPLEMNCRALDEERFCRCCRLILRRSDQLRDGWSWEALQGSEGYLKKTTLRPLPAGWGPEQDGGESPGAEPAALQPDPLVSTGSEEEDADLRLPSNSSSPVLQWEYHVLYSCSYATPVLYFRAFTLDGRSLTLEEIWKSIHPNFGLRLQNCPLNAVSQQPFFFLHPCRTEEFMGPVLQAALDHGRPVNYVLSWLSVVGPMVGLEVPLEYSTELHAAGCLSSTDPD
ncbi:PREDICTED: ubiquitin-like-conjugating enzyme ATG10 isoform X2 [Cyprinodon variegatus]|uniref:ubiquitin-like-conjugating enzyme ATG10 isoform X2 n=1 Tax=Cyprinodon variegatus TaxID=28743 RepID=UPI0007429FAA|nr:PREDICTED: ubiquitin-like-conjugating enzyme ATG10 isoform X2 [Cyprinodon variegatus]